MFCETAVKGEKGDPGPPGTFEIAGNYKALIIIVNTVLSCGLKTEHLCFLFRFRVKL